MNGIYSSKHETCNLSQVLSNNINSEITLISDSGCWLAENDVVRKPVNVTRKAPINHVSFCLVRLQISCRVESVEPSPGNYWNWRNRRQAPEISEDAEYSWRWWRRWLINSNQKSKREWRRWVSVVNSQFFSNKQSIFFLESEDYAPQSSRHG